MIDLKNCNSLQSLPASIFKLKYLAELDLTGVSKFKDFPELLEPMGNLNYLCLNGTDIEELPESIERLFGLQRLELKNCNRLQSLPASIFKLKCLGELYLTGSSKFKHFPEILKPMGYLKSLWLNGTAVEELPESIDHLFGLRRIELKNCNGLLSLPGSICKLKYLGQLDLTGISKFKNFPEILEPMENLKYLCLNGTAVEELDESIERLFGLQRIELKNCNRLLSLPASIFKLKYLRQLDLTGCSKFEYFPEILEPMGNLKYLCLNGTAVKKLPESIERLFGLQRIELKNCNRLLSLPASIYKLKDLGQLDLTGCSKFKDFPEVLEPMENLDSIFWLNERAGGELPKKIKHRCGFRIGVELKNCKSLLTLPSSICKLKSLVKLDLTGSSKFEDFPEILEPMGNLKYLRLNGTAVKGLPKSIENLVGLLRIELKNCNMLMSLPTSICKLKYLEELDLTGSFKFEDFPEILEPMENLKYLWLHGTVEKFLESIERLFALRRIELKNCNRLMSPPTNICKRRREEFDASGSEMFSSYEEQEDDVLPQTMKRKKNC